MVSLERIFLVAVVGLVVFLSPAEAAGPKGDFIETLFNGVDLGGWNVEGGRFRVEEGLLVVAGGEGWLRSDWLYENFVFHVEWRAAEEGYDGGIFFKAGRSGGPWPEEAYRISLAQDDVGTVSGVEGARAVDAAVRPPGQWNAFDLTCLGPIAELKINGRVAWQVTNLDPRSGFLGLQAKGPRIDFRNLQVREIAYRPLVSGEGLRGWQAIGLSTAWEVKEGILSGTGGGAGWLSTRRETPNFVLRLEYRLPAGGKAGVVFRAPWIGDPAYQGIEVPVLDDAAPEHARLPKTQSTGALYDVVAPSQQASRSAGAWNQLEVRAEGRQVRVVLNGVVVVDSDLNRLGLHYPKHPGLLSRRGYIGLRHDGSGVEFRNLRLRALR